MKGQFSTCVGAMLAVCTPAAAQGITSPTIAEQPGAAACELHVWPANDMRSTYFGWFHGGIVDGAVQGRQGYRKLPASPLAEERQAGILQSLGIAKTVGLGGYRTVVHEHALDSRTIRGPITRLVKDAPSCYAELIVDDVFFQEDVVNGRFFKGLYRFRSFEGDVPKRNFGSYTQVKLLLFPPATPEAINSALDEVAQAYQQSISQFGAALNAQGLRDEKQNSLRKEGQ